MRRFCVLISTVLIALGATYCTWDTVDTSMIEQGFGSERQGTQLQGTVLQGAVAGMTMQGFQFEGATLNGVALTNVHIEKGELIANQNQTTFRDFGLAGAHLYAQVHNVTANPPVSVTIEYKIDSIVAETAANDPTLTLNTYLYSISQNVDGTGNWQPACGPDADGRRAAIPIAATWNEHGDRVESPTLFTFGCTTGVIAKCYRWGYRPWLTGYGDVTATHYACTRGARADYCGNGKFHTRDGTAITIWDNLPPMGPVRTQGTTPLLMLFEAGWSTSGAVCLSHTRWVTGGLLIAAACPDRLIAPSLPLIGGTVCDTMAEALGQNAGARIYNESNLNLNLDLLGL
jgi:hypothetical protein